MAINTTSSNKDIDYIQKDFASSTDAMINFATVNFGPGTSANRLWSNFNIDSFSRNWLEIVAFTADVFFFYFDNQATQSYLQTATVRSAVLDISKQFGFVPSTASSASGTAVFTVTGNGTIPRGFRVAASNGAEFFVTDDIINVSGPGQVNGGVLQGIVKGEQFTSAGLQNEEFNLLGPNVIIDSLSLNINDVTPQVTVSGNVYTLVDSFIRHNGEDTDAITDSLGDVIGGGGRVFTIGEKPNGVPFLKFGDGIFGRKLLPSELVTITYRTGGGTIGNVGADTLNTLVDSNAIVSSVINTADFSGGADEQSIEQLRELIPASLRTLDRAVAEMDYSDILTTTFTQVFAASTAANNTDPGIDLDIFVVPQGNGITSITANSVLKTTLENYIDRRKMVTVQFQILDAFGIDTLIGLEVFISDTTSRATVTNAIETALVAFFDLSTGGTDSAGIGFAQPILIKDIFNIVEDIAGVERFEIQQLSYKPRIDKQLIGLVTDYNTSDVTIFPNVSEREWLLAAAGEVTRTEDEVIIANTGLIGFTYTSVNGELAYTFPFDLSGVSSGDKFVSGAGEEEETDYLMPAFAALTDGDHFLIGAASDATLYYVYMDTTGGDLSDPAVGGRTGIKADVSGDTTDIQVATTVAAAINGIGDFFADNSGSTSNTVNVQNVAIGETTDASNVNMPGPFAITVTQQGTNANVDITILGVDTENNKLFLTEGLLVSNTVTTSVDGQIKRGATTFESFKAFKKLLGVTTNLSTNSITDNNLDLSVARGVGVLLSATQILDNSKIYVPAEFATGDFYLVDSQDNIWEITDNDSNTITTDISAVNDAAIVSIAAGEYKIVTKLVGSQITFQGNVFNIQFNTDKTFFSIAGQFSQIGTIGDDFTVSTVQSNIGNLGVALDLISHDTSTGIIRLNSSPDLTGINSSHILIDSSGQILNVIGVDNRAQPSVQYETTNRDDQAVLEDSGLGIQVGQGFKVSISDTYAVVSWFLKREGNIIGNLTARIVADSGGLPDLGSPVAASEPISITSISETDFEKILFSFVTPPALVSGTQYHLVLSSDASYQANQISEVVAFSNAGLETFTYNTVSGDIVYDGAVNLSSVVPGNFFQDDTGTRFKIIAVDDSTDTVTIATGQSVDLTVNDAADASIIANDRILVGTDTSSPTSADGELSRFDGASWSDSTLGPSPSGINTDAIFSIEGTKTITVDSNLTAVTGTGATITERYYDDENEVSLAIGISNGTITSATDVNALGLGTVATVANRNVDRFEFRTSRFADDIVNLRPNEIPQLSANNIALSIFGGVD